MYTFADYLDKINRFFTFSRQEVNTIIISVMAFGLIVGFNDGRPVFELGHWSLNLINSIIVVALAIIVHHTAQRLLGIYMGFKVEHTFWFYGIIIGLFLAVLTNGAVPFIASTGVMLTVLERHRLGYFRYGLSYWSNGWISLIGPVANIVAAIMLKFLVFFSGSALIEKAILVNIAFAISNMLPIPKLDGANVFFSSPFVYIFSFGSIIGVSFMLLYFKTLALATVILSSLLLGLLFAVFYFKLLEERI